MDSNSFSGAGTILKTGAGYVRLASTASALSGFTGTINVQAGMLGVNGGGVVSAPQATLNVGTGATFDLRTGGLAIDQLTGSGTVTTTFSSGGTLSVGNNNGSSTFSGAISNGSSSLTLIKNGTGTLTLNTAEPYTGATTINGGTVILSTTNNILQVTTVRVNAGATLTQSGNGAESFNNVLTLAGGTLASQAVPAGNALFYGTIILNAGLTAGGVATTSTISAMDVAMAQGGGTVFTVNPGASSGIDLDVTGSIFHASGVGDSGLTKTGTGVMSLDGVNSYTSATKVNAGTLLIRGSISGSTTTVSSGATLGGDGTAGPVTVNSGGFITAGPSVGSIGKLNTGALTLAGTYSLTLNSTTNQADDLNITGSLTLSGATLNTTDLQLGAGAVNLTIAQYTGSLNGTFAGLAQGASVDNGLYTINYGANSITLVPVPEPGALISLLGGTGMLLGLTHSRRRKISKYL
jgi:autotransporter-associated beta strand protein